VAKHITVVRDGTNEAAKLFRSFGRSESEDGVNLLAPWLEAFGREPIA